jgi:hypothetical protein
MAAEAVFNGALETGLRSLTLLVGVFPEAISLQRLVVFDYLVVHTEDVDGGPASLHPATPRRGAELLVRRERIQAGLRLYESRNLIDRRFESDGVYVAASEWAGAFLDAFGARYVADMRDKAAWVADRFGGMDDVQLRAYVDDRVGDWGAEFEFESLLWDGAEQA